MNGKLSNLIRKGVKVLRFIRLDSENRVIFVRYGESIVEGEIKSDAGDPGDIRQPNGTFITPKAEPGNAKLTLEEQIEQLKIDNLILMDVLATIYEEMITKGVV